ncbi:MAG: hypothetical protein COA86_02255 [Kangiella sp.]|nr:MAG: hypothetical protein COA86_02255 [Kangiella sp.]
MNLYLTTRQLAERIGYTPRTIRDRLKDVVFIEGKHYVRPFGSARRVLYIWEIIEKEMILASVNSNQALPMANGGTCHG